MTLRCLVFSDDERAVRLLQRSLSDLEIEVEHCTDLQHAQQLLLQQKFDGVIADCEIESGPELLRSVRRSKHNRRSIIFALTGTQIKMGDAFDLGAHFVIYRPLSSERAKRTLNAAHGLMMREKRMHFRHPANAEAKLRIGQRTLDVELADLTQHGALIHAGAPIKKDQPVQLTFTLPDTSFEVEVSARVARSDPTGRVGLKFETLSDESQARLLQWAVQRSIETPQQKATPKTASPNPAKPLPVRSNAEETVGGVDFEVEVIEPPHDDIDSRQRATLRGQHHAAVKVLTFDNSLPVIIQGKCKNISELGLAAKVDEELGLGDAVLLQVDLPGTPKPVVLHATVRHRDEDRYGFEFVALDPAVKDLIRKCVNDLPVE
ncbi:MAG: PilZ domain-containing protein [Terriglobales bacterium]